MVAGAARSAGGPFSSRYRLITIGTVVLVFVAAFENLAVTTVMPVISAELDGERLYAVAFAAPLAVSVVGMVLAGQWCDRSGPRVPLSVAVASFVAGLLIAGTAGSMGQLVTGRLVQGLGSGGVTVALYVIVARVYPSALQPRIFGLMSAAWVIPALVGPFVAGVLGDTVGWRWVFLGVAGISVPALALVVPVMRTLRGTDTGAGTGEETGAGIGAESGAEPAAARRIPLRPARLLWAVLLASGILALSVSAELGGVATGVLAALGAVLALVALRPLTPRGTLLLRRGLPRVVLTRLVLAGGFFATETYLPYLLTREHGFSPAAAGLALSVSGVAWGATSLVQGRFASRMRDRATLAAGTGLVLTAVAITLATAALGLPGWVAIAGWAASGTGMGLAYPRLSVLLLSGSAPAEQGANSSALNIADAAGPALALSVAGLLFPAVPGGGFAAVFALGLVLAVGATALAGGAARTGDAPARASGTD